MIRIFIGWEPRVAVQFHVLAHSILEHASIPVQIIPLNLKTLPIKRRGLTEFSFSRFLVPFLSGFEGWSLFLDSDMLFTGDVKQLVDACQGNHAVNAINTTPAYERASVMLFLNEHEDNRKLTPEFIETTDTPLHLLKWTEAINWIPNRFNFLCGYDAPEWCQGQTPVNIHYTQGVPAWPETANCDYADHWIDARARAFTPAVSWSMLMGSSNHAAEGPGGVKIPAPRVPDAVRQPLRSPHSNCVVAHAPGRFRADGQRS